MTDVEQIHTDIEACDRALHELVSAIIVHDAAREAKRMPTGEIRLTPFRELTDLDRAAFRAMTTDPVRNALREGIKKLGREIHRLGGGTGSMLDSLDKVAGMDAANAGRRAVIMDSAWNGTGAGDDRWWS